MEAGLICIFIDIHCIFIPIHCILNEARVSSYIQDIVKHEDFFFKEKTFKYAILVIKDEFKGYNY